jgi:hypothetical protein
MKRLLALLCALGVLAGFSGAAIAAPVITFDLSAGNDMIIPEVGDSVKFTIYAVVADDGGSPGATYGLKEFAFIMEYDPSRLRYAIASVDRSVWSLSSMVEPDIEGGTLLMRGTSNSFQFPSGVPSPAPLGAVTFRAKEIGQSDLVIYDADKGSETKNFVLAAPYDGADLDVQLKQGLLVGSITNVPLPGSAILLLSGLLSFLGLRKKTMH